MGPCALFVFVASWQPLCSLISRGNKRIIYEEFSLHLYWLLFACSALCRSTFPSDGNQYYICKGHIRDDDPAFGLLPISTYLVGATFRTLPNDCLEKVLIYARRTGVKWFVVDRTPVTVMERVFYNNAQWYWSSPIEDDYRDLVRCRCRGRDGNIALYEIL